MRPQEGARPSLAQIRTVDHNQIQCLSHCVDQIPPKAMVGLQRPQTCAAWRRQRRALQRPRHVSQPWRTRLCRKLPAMSLSHHGQAPSQGCIARNRRERLDEPGSWLPPSSSEQAVALCSNVQAADTPTSQPSRHRGREQSRTALSWGNTSEQPSGSTRVACTLKNSCPFILLMEK